MKDTVSESSLALSRISQSVLHRYIARKRGDVGLNPGHTTRTNPLSQGSTDLFLKVQRANKVSFADHMISVAIAHLWAVSLDLQMICGTAHKTVCQEHCQWALACLSIIALSQCFSTFNLCMYVNDLCAPECRPHVSWCIHEVKVRGPQGSVLAFYPETGSLVFHFIS